MRVKEAKVHNRHKVFIRQLCFPLSARQLVKLNRDFLIVWKAEEILQAECDRNRIRRFTAGYSGHFSCSRPSSHAESEYADLNSASSSFLYKTILSVLAPTYLREIPESLSVCSCGDGPSVKPIIRRLSYLSAPLGKQGKSSGGQRDKCPFFTPSALLCTV